MQKITSKGDRHQATKLRVCKFAVGMFYKHGTKNVKMDDISKKLKISKRTLYELFGDKEQLLYESMKYKAEADYDELSDYVHNTAENVMQVLIKFYAQRMDVVKKINPLFYSDLERYPNVRRLLKEQNMQQRKRSLQFYRKGVEDGYFRKEINYEIITRMSDAYLDYIMRNKLYDYYSMNELFSNFISVMVRGYCTEKGENILKNFKDLL